MLGAVQVPPDGQPLVFLADHPTTGGYPVVGRRRRSTTCGSALSCGRGSPVGFRQRRRVGLRGDEAADRDDDRQDRDQGRRRRCCRADGDEGVQPDRAELAQQPAHRGDRRASPALDAVLEVGLGDHDGGLQGAVPDRDRHEAQRPRRGCAGRHQQAGHDEDRPEAVHRQAGREGGADGLRRDGERDQQRDRTPARRRRRRPAGRSTRRRRGTPAPGPPAAPPGRPAGAATPPGRPAAWRGTRGPGVVLVRPRRARRASAARRGAASGPAPVAPTHTSTLAQPAPTRPQTATIGAAAAVATRFRTRAEVSPAAITRR